MSYTSADPFLKRAAALDVRDYSAPARSPCSRSSSGPLNSRWWMPARSNA